MTKCIRRFATLTVAIAAVSMGMAQSARATLTYTIYETDSSFTVNPATTPGFTVSGANPTGGTDSASLMYIDGVLVTGTAVNGGFSIPGLTIESTGNSTAPGGQLQSKLLDNETEISGVGLTGPLYFAILVSQDAYSSPSTNPLIFSGNLTENTVLDSSSTFQSTLTTPGVDGGSATLGPVTGLPGRVDLGPTPVPNGTPGNYTVLSLTHVTLGATGVPGANITLTGEADISAAPEPATLAMAFSALPLLGIAVWRSRRKVS